MAARLAELIGGLSLASDLANDFPAEKTLRTVILATETARCASLDVETVRDAFHVTLLRFLGCTGFAHEEAHVYGAGNDQVTRNVMAMADPADPIGTLRAVAGRIGEGGRARERVGAVARLLFDGEAVQRHARAQCDTSVRLAEMVGVSEPIRAALRQVCERYDGRGAPAGSSGTTLAIAVRLLHLADVAEIAYHRHGPEAALAELERRAGKHLDPALVRTFLQHARPLFDAITGTSVWERYLAAEPEPHTLVSDPLDVARAFACFADLKSVFTLGHSTGVADIAKRAAEDAGLARDSVRDLHHAALLHDLGRVAVPTGLWDKPGPLGIAEWERVRLHAYQTERLVRVAPAWGGAARIAAAAHERLDGGGYHRSVPSTLLPMEARILAAADVLQALTEPRPHRGPHTREQAEAVLRDDVKRGALDRDAVDAVLGVRRVAPTGWPRGLSHREVEVLRLVARGKSNKEIGVLLGISPRTVQNHVAHAYDKAGVYSRAGAALFVTEHALLG